MESTCLSSLTSSSPSITVRMDSIPTPTQASTIPPPPPTDAPNETNVGQKRKAKNASPLWGHFTKVTNPDNTIDHDKCTCNYCKEVVPCHKKNNGTSSMWSHARKCKLCPLYLPVDKNQTTLNKDNVSGAMVYHQFNQKRCAERCAEMVARDELPFRFVEGAGFKAYSHELQPRFKIPSRKAIARLVWEKYQFEKAKLMSQLNSTRVSTTTDTWTSIQNINYLVLTAHFMDNDWKLHKRIINFCVITSHKGEDIGKVLEMCLRQWEINKIFTIIVDNASANNTAVDYIRRRLKSYKTLLFDGEYLHLRCACHIINLIVKDGIAELQDGIQAIWNCVKYIRSSPQRIDKFREFAMLEHMRANANVPLDVAIRWNSTYLMLEAALKYENVFTRMADEDAQFNNYFAETDKHGNPRVGPPVEEDWKNASAFVVFLKKFYDSTLKLSAWKSVTANLVFAEMIGLQYEIDKKMTSSDLVMKRVASSMKKKFSKYWFKFENVNKIILIANVLDLRYKMQYHSKAMKKVGVSDENIVAITTELKRILMKMYEEYKDPTSPSSQVGVEVQCVAGRGLDIDEIDDIMAECMQERLDGQSEIISNEVDQYLSDKYVSMYVKDFDILAWWKVNASTYPVLACLARDVFAIPCSTVASENAFSLGSRIVDPFRASLTPRMVEALVCSSDWLRSEEVNFYKEPTEDELEFYISLEEVEKESLGSNFVETPVESSTSFERKNPSRCTGI